MCGFVCQKKEEQRNRECVCVCVAVSDPCPHVWLSPLRAGQNGTGRRAPNWAQMAATDRDGGDINTLINNYPNNDTGYTGVGGRRTEGQEGEKETGREDVRKRGKMRRGERVTGRVKGEDRMGGREGGEEGKGS